MQDTKRLWISWDRAKRAHAADIGVQTGDVRNGSFPLACGRWAPDGWDANVYTSSKARCSKCQKVLA